jgi:hypothetical protein
VLSAFEAIETFQSDILLDPDASDDTKETTEAGLQYKRDTLIAILVSCDKIRQTI